jgi:hypothetical protein
VSAAKNNDDQPFPCAINGVVVEDETSTVVGRNFDGPHRRVLHIELVRRGSLCGRLPRLPGWV